MSVITFPCMGNTLFGAAVAGTARLQVQLAEAGISMQKDCTAPTPLSAVILEACFLFLRLIG